MSGAASGKKSKASASHSHAPSQPHAYSHHHKEHATHKSEKHAQAPKSAFAPERDARRSHDAGERKAADYTQKKLDKSVYESSYAAPKKKKKKFKLKRFFKNLGRELQAFGAKLIEVEEHPQEQASVTQPYQNDLGFSNAGFSQKKPLFESDNRANRTTSSKAQPATAKSVWQKIQKALLSATRFVARGVYMGVRKLYQYLMKLPQRTLLIGSGAFGVLLVTVVILAIALPGKGTKADQDAPIAAFTALETEQTALGNTALDGTQTGDTAADGAQTGDTTADGAQTADTTADGADTQADGTQAEIPGVPAFTQDIKSGDDGEIIAAIQARLMELGYMDSDEPTMHFGPLTQSALKSFQRHNGLGDDGICGQSTYEALMREDAKHYVMQLGDSGPDVEGVQQRLYELGYLDNKANIKGVFGDKTVDAAKAFQKKNDLTADGKVGAKTLEMLYGEDVVSNAYRLGDENRVIQDCQTALKKLGYITFKPDGVMGRATVSAIKAFQQANGLTRDGALGPVTRDMILSGKAQEMVLQLGDYGTDVKNMQTRLAKLNYLSSANATGYFGEITEDAVRAFQKRAGLTADGKVGGVTLTMMNSSSAKKAAAAPSTKKETKTGGSSSSGSSSGSSSSGSSSGISDKSGVEKLVALAESKIGSKYVRGAKGPSSFDCSGFVYWCLKNAGVSTSYMTSIMWRSTSRFSRFTDMDSIQRGDILVFSGESDSAGHVGIYLGGGKMIDASSSEGQVRQSSSVLSSGGYWSRHFICAYHVF